MFVDFPYMKYEKLGDWWLVVLFFVFLGGGDGIFSVHFITSGKLENTICVKKYQD